MRYVITKCFYDNTTDSYEPVSDIVAVQTMEEAVRWVNTWNRNTVSTRYTACVLDTEEDVLIVV